MVIRFNISNPIFYYKQDACLSGRLGSPMNRTFQYQSENYIGYHFTDIIA
jgi:hypothetical protein